MGKKSQLTLFIIFGFIIVVAFWFIFSIDREKEEAIEKDIKRAWLTYAVPIQSYVQSCVDDVSRNAISFLGLSGGYLEPEWSLDNFFFHIGYLYYDDLVLVPSKEEMEIEISNYVYKNLDKCINLSIFEEQYDISISQPDANSFIGNNSVRVDVNYPIQIKKEESIIELSDFSTNIPVRLGYIRDGVEELVGDIVDDPDYISFGDLTKYDLDINLRSKYLDSIVYFIMDNKSELIANEPYLFVFGTRFNTTQYLELNNTPPVLLNVKDFNIKEGVPFYYNIDANDYDGDTVEYSALTSLFSIDKNTVVISFTPSDFDVG